MTFWEAAGLFARVSVLGVLIITVLVGGGAIVGWIVKAQRR